MKMLNLEFIAKRRSELKLTLQEMATALGFKNASTYMKYEKGEYAFSANHLPVIAKVLGCDIKELFFENQFAKPANKSAKNSA